MYSNNNKENQEIPTFRNTIEDKVGYIFHSSLLEIYRALHTKDISIEYYQKIVHTRNIYGLV